MFGGKQPHHQPPAEKQLHSHSVSSISRGWDRAFALAAWGWFYTGQPKHELCGLAPTVAALSQRMHSRMSRKTQNFWDKVSGLSRSSPKEPGPVARKTVNAALEHLSKDSAVLDVGCGSGELTLAIARNVVSAHAVDPSSGMIEVANAKLGEQGAANVVFAQGDLSTLQDRKGTFTAVIAFNVLHYMQDIPEASRQTGALLARDGLFLSSTACMGERRSFLGMLMRLLTRLGIVPSMHFFKLADLTDLIARGGFQITETKKLSDWPEYFIVAKKSA
ncbi:MAG: class I SAM-dependent methyltransferase [Acidobacteria bacterium]|nr:class I SAM-dependent methyltransferase [Acidobacteriota bacterium]